MPNSGLELRAGILHSCQCGRRDGLQDTCSRSECGGRAACMAEPEPLCGPAVNERIDHHRRTHRGPAATSTPPEPESKVVQRKAKKHSRKDKFLKMGRECYIDNPPLPEYSFKPCAIHSQRYF